jgi:hypothetical protein
MGVIGAVGDFAVVPGEKITVSIHGDVIIARIGLWRA